MQIIMYNTQEEAQRIIEEKTAQGMVLVEVANITAGNFLGFADNPIPQPTPIEAIIANIENTLDLILLKQEGIL